MPTAVSRHVESLRSRGERVSEQAYIHDLHARLDDPSISWEVVHHDDPAVALTHLDSHRAPAVIAMATHGREGFVARVFGSITTATVARATCPVLVQRPTGDLNLKELE